MLKKLLDEYQIKLARIINFDPSKIVRLDLSKDNEALQQVDLNDEEGTQVYAPMDAKIHSFDNRWCFSRQCHGEARSI